MSELHICRGPVMEERSREDIGVRWCFSCRKRTQFQFIVTAPAGRSYYGPNPSIRCGACGQVDGDVGFGRCREWEG